MSWRRSGALKAHRPERSWKRDVSYLREAFLREPFGECCPEREIGIEKERKCEELRLLDDKRRKLWPISSPCFVKITTGAISEFFAARIRIRGLTPKGANLCREVVNSVLNGAIDLEKARMSMGKKPAANVARYKEHACKISYLTLPQIEEQLKALEGKRQLRTMVAMLIYAGLRREELLWLTADDVETDPLNGQNSMIRLQAKTTGGGTRQPKTRVKWAIPNSSALAALLREYEVFKSDHRWFIRRRRGLGGTRTTSRRTFGRQTGSLD